MPAELSLTFPDHEHVLVSLRDGSVTRESPVQAFAPPFDAKTRSELTWYLETYSAHYTTELDDARAAGIVARLKDWGRELFLAALADYNARSLFDQFRNSRKPGRVVSISSLHPAVLAQPWELLCDPSRTFVFLESPSISIRRRLTHSDSEPYQPKPKDRLHLLFVVSRPDDAGLIDPRADPLAVLDALDAEAPGRATVEFLRPPTLPALVARLNDDRKPAVDILHFDGHGAYDPDGRLADASRRTLVAGGVGHLLRGAPAQGQQGYLLFEDNAHESALVPASAFGDLLQSKQVGLVILSACQSATVGGEDIQASVAPRLIQAGIPSVVAMTHSVLVETTRALGGHFYRELAAGRPVGTALDAARTQLYADPKRGERQRPSGSVNLLLQDWFVPAMYQGGADGALLKKGARKPDAPAVSRHNLPNAQESGFYGRTRELRDIERWFVDGTRRIVLTGFGGQGKTTLAAEAGRWLLRTGLFERVCFVGYAGFQGSDPVQVAVSTLATVLAVNLIDAEAARAALRETPTLLILDNLESLHPEARAALLSAASGWSAQGGSRVLVTTRPDDFSHPDFPASNSRVCRYLALAGLQPQDALDWFQALLSLPPEPAVPIVESGALRDLFGQVGFHPLSIGVLAQVLKQRRIADVAEALSAQLGRDGDPLLASLNLSLQRLDPEAQAILPGIGVFVDGAWEPMLLRVLELDEARWGRLRDGLRQAGLVMMEAIPGIAAPFLRFHPTLAPAMRARLPSEDLARVSARHRSDYYQLSGELYSADSQNPEVARGIAWRELPNLLAAVSAALEGAEDRAVDFADNLARFLRVFGRSRDVAALRAWAEAVASKMGSDAWYLTQSNRGQQLYEQGDHAAAQAVFSEILRNLGDEWPHQRATTLTRLARCHREQGQMGAAETALRGGLRELGALPTSREIRRLQGVIHTELGVVFRTRGDLDGAEKEYEVGMRIDAEIGDEHGVAVSRSALGGISLLRGDFPRAGQNYQDAINTFERLNEPRSVAVCYHQLGYTLSEAGKLSDAENAYREAGRIKESLGDPQFAAETWVNLANVIRQQGRPATDVEPWFRKALAAFEAGANRVSMAFTLSNLASLLSGDPRRVDEARDLATQALAIKQTLDPGAAQIWTTYDVLGDIAALQGDIAAARRCRADGRRTYAAAPIAREAVRRRRPLISAVLAVLRQPDRLKLEQALAEMVDNGWSNLVGALRTVADGQSDEDELCDPLGREDSLIVMTILRCLADPEAEQTLFSDQP